MEDKNNEIKKNRKFLRFIDSDVYKKVVPESDEDQKKPYPIFHKEYPVGATLIDLIHPSKINIQNKTYLEIVNTRISRRKYTQDYISLEQLSYLLWCTQGVRKEVKKGPGVGTLRTVPSSGAKSPFETYLVINRVENLKPGLYRYVSLEHKLLFVKEIEDPEKKLGELTYNQKFVGKGAVIFFWVSVPYRTEWRYSTLAHKLIAIDVGIVCENLYLACESIDLGTVAIGYYEQTKLDKLFDLDGEEEFVILLAPVGKFIKRVKLMDFFKNSKSEVNSEILKMYVGKFKFEEEILSFTVRNNQLVITIDHYEEVLNTRNKTEFYGKELIKAIRFTLKDETTIEKLEVLTTRGNIQEYEYLGSGL